MLHKHLQAHVVCKDCLSRTRTLRRAVHGRRHVCRRRVQLGQQETRLTATLITHDVPWDREAVREEVLGVRDGCFQEFLEIFIAFLVLVAGFAPLSDGFAVEDKDMEEGVEEEDDVRFDRDTVK